MNIMTSTVLILLTFTACAKANHKKKPENSTQEEQKKAAETSVPAANPPQAPSQETHIPDDAPKPQAPPVIPPVLFTSDPSLACTDLNEGLKVCEPKSQPEGSKLGMVQWKQWESPAIQGDYGTTRSDGTRKTSIGEKRDPGTFFVKSSAINLDQAATLSGGVGIMAWSECWDDPFQKPCWKPEETAFVIDMVATVDGTQKSLGRMDVHMNDLHVMPPTPRLGFGSTSEFKEIGFSTSKALLYENIQVRIYSIHPALGMRATRSFVRATW